MHGYAIVEDVVDAATLDRLDAEAAPFIESSTAGRDAYDGRFTRRTGQLIERCPTVDGRELKYMLAAHSGLGCA